MKVEIMSDPALKLRNGKLTVSRSDVYDITLLLLQQLEVSQLFVDVQVIYYL